MKDDINPILSTQLSRSQQIDLIRYASSILSIVFFVYLGIILGFGVVINTRMEFLRGGNLFQFFQLWNIPYNQIITIITLSIGGIITYRRVIRQRNMMKLARALEHLNYISENSKYDYRIESADIGELTGIIDSINRLVESTEHSLVEERRAEETKDELIANVSHDIRTPLTSTIGYLDAVIHHQYQSEEEKDNYIAIAYDKAKLMRTLVNDLFLYIESGQATYTIETQSIPIKFFFEQLAAEFELIGNEQNVDIVVEVYPEDLFVQIDVDKMARVFSNLISNAFKYGFGNVIRLRAYTSTDEASVFLETRNNGEILEESEYKSIFERSYRTEKSRTSEIPGSGLGLSIVKNIVGLHGGIVFATVEENETVFRIKLNNREVGDD
ncbi:two-component sensor histidine kinase [Aerococcaceae bacterium DSM 111021]|nr:two-component sensor histidine kinase [Aerococcaceae bacterium DSM 111021]